MPGFVITMSGTEITMPGSVIGCLEWVITPRGMLIAMTRIGDHDAAQC